MVDMRKQNQESRAGCLLLEIDGEARSGDVAVVLSLYCQKMLG